MADDSKQFPHSCSRHEAWLSRQEWIQLDEALPRLLYCCLFLPLLSLLLSETTAEHASATERSRVNHLIMVVFSSESWNQNTYFIKSNKPVNTKQSTNENSRLLRVNCSTGKTREIHACKS